MEPLPAAEWLPEGLQPSAAPAPLEVSGVALTRRPLDADSAAALARGLRDRAPDFKKLPIQEILRGLTRAHRAWTLPRSPHRLEAAALLARVTGYPELLVEQHLRRLFQSLSGGEMLSWLSQASVPWTKPHEFVALPMVTGPALTVVVSSGNIPGAAVPSVAQALLLKSPCLVKSSSEEPSLLPLYARSLAELAPELAPFLAVTGWRGGDAAVEEAVLREAEALIAYGGDEALLALRSRLPLRARFLPYGHRISFSAVARESLTRRAASGTARRAVRDLTTFDQQGCMSPQALYVEEGGEVSPAGFAELLARELERAERKLPRRPLSPAEAAAIHQFRASLEMRSFSTPGLRLWQSPGGTQWTVALDPDPTLRPCPLNRTAVVHPLPDLSALPALLEPVRSVLNTAVLAIPPERKGELATLLSSAGVTRLAVVGTAQEPIFHDPHDGVRSLSQLARYTSLELSDPAYSVETSGAQS
ncbi:MAG: acyl-CoA reductase [Armatimonadota bacterium]